MSDRQSNDHLLAEIGALQRDVVANRLVALDLSSVRRNMRMAAAKSHMPEGTWIDKWENRTSCNLSTGAHTSFGRIIKASFVSSRKEPIDAAQDQWCGLQHNLLLRKSWTQVAVIKTQVPGTDPELRPIPIHRFAPVSLCICVSFRGEEFPKIVIVLTSFLVKGW